MVQSWLEYRTSSKTVDVLTKNITDLLHFCLRLADVLALSGKGTNIKERVRLSDTPPGTPVQSRGEETRPPEEIQYD